MTDDELMLIAKVIAWVEGEEQTEAIANVARNAAYQDSAQQCAEDLGLVPSAGDAA